ncbi:MAG TPA: arylesterase [Verrucomicrobia bacterium]|nr:MAG: hypothetical protein A2X46_13710 [Lentisphaerae bacterium GWF2_57_35]HBA82469.1 arylesterase [Verrucomicrobiota bacterium]
MIKRCILACLILLTGGCARKAVIKPLTPDAVVVAFGDSLTSGYGVAPDDSYPSILSQLLGCQVINAGIPGEVSREGLGRLLETVRLHQPDLVVLCHGGNDLLHRTEPLCAKANVSQIIQSLKAQGIDVILVGVPEPGLWLSAARWYGDLAEEHGIPYESEAVSLVLSDALTRNDDRIHPNERGYRIMAESIAALIRSSESN